MGIGVGLRNLLPPDTCFCYRVTVCGCEVLVDLCQHWDVSPLHHNSAVSFRFCVNIDSVSRHVYTTVCSCGEHVCLQFLIHAASSAE